MYPSGVCTEPECTQVRERVLQFLRFQEITGGILYGEIAPDADVLAFVMPHFADRFPLENFVILDERRATAGIHPAGNVVFDKAFKAGVGYTAAGRTAEG